MSVRRSAEEVAERLRHQCIDGRVTCGVGGEDVGLGLHVARGREIRAAVRDDRVGARGRRLQMKLQADDVSADTERLMLARGGKQWTIAGIKQLSEDARPIGDCCVADLWRGSRSRRKIAIVALARKLLILLWAMLRKNEPYRPELFAARPT